jgi:hypothetical protein
MKQAERHPEFPLRDAMRRQECRSLAVAERDRTGFVEQQHVDVAGSFNCTT